MTFALVIVYTLLILGTMLPQAGRKGIGGQFGEFQQASGS